MFSAASPVDAAPLMTGENITHAPEFCNPFFGKMLVKLPKE
jgi:hypothetical protein